MLSIDEHASFFKDIDPLEKYKKWTARLATNQSSTFNEITQIKSLYSQKAHETFIVSNSIDWFKKCLENA